MKNQFVALATILTGSVLMASPVHAQTNCNHPVDINRDGIVNLADLSLLLSQYHLPAKHGNHLNADLNCDGLVNVTDLSTLLRSYNQYVK